MILAAPRITPNLSDEPLLEVFRCIFLPDLNRSRQHRLSTIDFPDDPVDHHAEVLGLIYAKGAKGTPSNALGKPGEY